MYELVGEVPGVCRLLGSGQGAERKETWLHNEACCLTGPYASHGQAAWRGFCIGRVAAAAPAVRSTAWLRWMPIVRMSTDWGRV